MKEVKDWTNVKGFVEDNLGERKADGRKEGRKETEEKEKLQRESAWIYSKLYMMVVRGEMEGIVYNRPDSQEGAFSRLFYHMKGRNSAALELVFMRKAVRRRSRLATTNSNRNAGKHYSVCWRVSTCKYRYMRNAKVK